MKRKLPSSSRTKIERTDRLREPATRRKYGSLDVTPKGLQPSPFDKGYVFRRLPMRNFKNIFAKDINVVTLGRVQSLLDAGKLDPAVAVTVETLKAAGIVKRPKDGIRLLNDGVLRTAVTFEVVGASKAAIESVEKAGGKVLLLKAGSPSEAASEKTSLRRPSLKVQKNDEIISKILARVTVSVGSKLEAKTWFDTIGIPGFDGKTAREVVIDGDGILVIDYLNAIEAGSFQ